MSQIVPLTTSPNQSLAVALAVNGGSLGLNLKVSYNTQAGFWVMDVADKLGNELVSCVPLLTGVWPAGNILAPYDYLKIGSAFLINLNGAATDWPDDTNLGSSFSLLWDDN
jgi:hypothetical protein